MTTYTIWNGSLPAGTSSSAVGGRTDGIQFTVTVLGQVTGVWFYVPSSETALAGSGFQGYLWSTTDGLTGTQLATAAGVGTFTAGAWNFIQFSSAVSISTGVSYVAGVSSPNWLQFVHSYYVSGGPGFGGFSSGPISVPDDAGALGGIQQSFVNTANTFPLQSNASAYGVDVSFVTSGGASVSGVVATSALAAPAGTVTGGAAVAGSVATSVLAAPVGSVTAGAVVLGSVATSALSAPAGIASSGRIVIGVTAASSLQAPAGSVTAGAAVLGSAATAALTALVGQAHGGAVVLGAVAVAQLQAPAGSAGTRTALALDPFGLKGTVTALNYGGQVIGVNIEDYTGNGYGGSVS